MYLAKTNITDAALKSGDVLQSLVKLDLSETKITERTKELFKASSLQTLDLGYTEVTDAGLKVLSTLKSLQSLYLTNTNVTDVGLKKWRD